MKGWEWAGEGIFPEIAVPFGGGFGRTHRLVCGALSGALLALGAAHAAGGLSRDEASQAAGQLVCDFEEAFGSVLCCELVGIDPASPDWRERYETSQARHRICQPCVQFAVRSSWELMQQNRGTSDQE